jgi:hypothetical protein
MKNFEDDELDILLFLKSYEESNKEIFNLKYTFVFMIFDFEPQHPYQHFDTIQKHTTSFLLPF